MKKQITSILFMASLSIMGCSSSEDLIHHPFSTEDFKKEEKLSVDAKLRLTHHTFFNFDSVMVSKLDISNIKAHAKYISERPNIKVQVEGHADESGTDDYNRDLGLRRAKRIANVLRTYGVKKEQIILRSYSAEKPLSKTSDSLNRRATIIY